MLVVKLWLCGNLKVSTAKASLGILGFYGKRGFLSIFLGGFKTSLNIPVRRRRLSGIPGSKSPAEWEA